MPVISEGRFYSARIAVIGRTDEILSASGKILDAPSSKQTELDQLLGLTQQLAQKETSDFAVLDRQSEEQIVAATLEFELPNVHRETFLVQLGYKSRRIATLKAGRELRTEAVEHRRGDIFLEGRVPFSDECTSRSALGRRKHFLKHRFDIWRRLSPPDLRSDTQEKRNAKKKASRCCREPTLRL
jgi:hypothetical protein